LVDYLDYHEVGLTGGFQWEPAHEAERPRMIPILVNGKPYLDSVRCFKVSKDGAVAVIALKNSDILVYKVTFCCCMAALGH